MYISSIIIIYIYICISIMTLESAESQVAKRAQSKPTYPGHLDHLVAGESIVRQPIMFWCICI